MNGDTQASDRKVVEVSKEEADRLKEQASEFQAKFDEEKASFSFSEETDYFIVSRQFLEEWAEYCTAHTLERARPQIMNAELLTNDKLTEGLKQGIDFEFVSLQLFKTFADYQGFEIRRKAVMIGNEKRIPVYLESFQYLMLTHQDLRFIDREARYFEKLKIHKAQASEQTTIEDFLNLIREDRMLSQTKQLRVWKIGDLTLNDVYKHIKKETAPIRSYEYRIQFVGKKIEQIKAKLGDLEIGSQEFLVIECKDQLKKWHLYSDKEGKCESCYSFTVLKVICGCKKVGYCSEQCQQKDRRFHDRYCDYAEQQELNRKVQMVITPNSSKGAVGLSNLGNTCFMNSCLQCLSNTVPLTEYFLSGFFEEEINRTNPIGTKGKLAKTYAKFIKGMWCDSNRTFSPYNIKGAVSSINPMFSGYAQHDSQQFFSFIVDGLHEDLNRIEKKPYVESVDSNGREDKVVALESWITHTKRNQSIVVDLMTGQYKSKVTCPDCGLESITFDPFITVTLPIPQKVKTVHPMFLVHPNFEKQTERLYLSYEKTSPKVWFQEAARVSGLEEGTFGLYVATVNEDIYKVGRDSLSEMINKIQNEKKNLFMVRYSDQDLEILKEDHFEVVVRLATMTSYDWENAWFKFPFFFSKKQFTGLDLSKRIAKFLYSEAYDQSPNYAHKGESKTYEQFQALALKGQFFSLYLKTGRKKKQYMGKIQVTFSHEEIIQNDTNLAELLEEQQSYKDYEIDVRFSKAQKRQFGFDRLKNFEDTMEKPISKSHNSENITVSLDQCFQNLREVERLEAGNEWYCPKCKDHKMAEKQISIFKAPKILILHLKRFKQKGMLRKEKNESKVKFPLELDMQEYLIDPLPMGSYVEEAKKLGVYIEPKTDKPVQANEKPIYDLYAVSNHFGGLGGGHYTACAKNHGRWYDFNDSSVRETSSNSICGSGAYILFYQRRD